MWCCSPLSNTQFSQLICNIQSLCCYQTLLILINSSEMKPIKCAMGIERGSEPLCDCLLCNKRRRDAKQAAGQSCRCAMRCDTPRVHAWLQPNSGSVMWTNHIIVTKESKFIFAPRKRDSFDFAGAERESYFLRTSS